IEQPGEVLLQPVDAALGPFADRDAGHEAVVGVHRSPPWVSWVVSPRASPPGGFGEPSVVPTSTFSEWPVPAAVSSVTRGITPRNLPSASTTTRGFWCWAEGANSSAIGVS